MESGTVGFLCCATTGQWNGDTSKGDGPWRVSQLKELLLFSVTEKRYFNV